MKKFTLSVSILALMTVSTAAFAQAEAAPDETTDALPKDAPKVVSGDNQAIVVTGSRIRSGTFVTPTPVTSATQEQLVTASPGNLADGLRQIPSVIPGGGPTAGGGTRAGGQNFLNLRGLGNSRSLILLDSRRFTPAGPDLLVDVNLFPQGLVQRVDVVTGGASAAYGSDAVAGVVNFVLNKRYEGVKIDITSGLSERSDNREIKISSAFGTSLLDNRLHIIGGAEYFDSNGVNGDERKFRTSASNMITDPARAGFLVRADDVRTPFTTGGLVVIGTGGSTANNRQIFGTQFGVGGAPQSYNYGMLSSTLLNAAGFQSGGDGFRVSTGQEIVRPLTRKTAFAHFDFEVSDNVLLYAEGLYGDTRSVFQSSPTTRTLAIRRTNPYLIAAAPALVAQMTTLGVTGFNLNRLTLEGGLTLNDNNNETVRGVVGIEGKIGGWSWDLNYQHGRNDNHNPTRSNLITANFTRAVNAVTAAAENPGGIAVGAITCADLVSTDAALRAAAVGCAPFNPFGDGSPSKESLNYVFGTSVFDTLTKQDVIDFSASGSLFDLPAGPLAVAFGAEYRKISANTVSDLISQSGGFRLVNQQNFSGEFSVKEVFGEVQIPILKDSPIGQSVDANVAARYTDYSTSGGVNTWKAGLVWQLVDEFKIRSTYSRDIRAPHLEELFATGRQNNITIVDTLTNQTYLSVPNQTFGNSALTPEKAKTLVLGMVYQPSWIDGLSLAVDYYRIKINDVIRNVGGQNAVTQCNLSGQKSPLCEFVIRNAAQAVIRTRTSPINLTSQETSGVDVEAQYRRELGDGTLTLRGIATYVAENIVNNPLNAINVDDVGNLQTQSIGSAQPRWRGNLTVNYDTESWAVNLQGRYIHSFTWDKLRTLGLNTDFNSVGSQVYLDGQIVLKIPAFGEKQELFLNVSNLLDKTPPFAPNPGGATPLPTDPNLYDQVGRMFRVGIRARF
ncbi:CirA Outer membrane receptor proteins, mostly Fe transport [Sphingomonadaceae bacterium]